VLLILFASLFEAAIYAGLARPKWLPDSVIPLFRAHYLSADRQIIQVSDCGKYDSLLFYRLNAGVCVFRNREFEVENRINQFGVRDDEESMVQPGIVVLGDSYAMGWGVEQDKTFPEVIQAQTGLKTLNLGMSSYGTAREVLMFSQLEQSPEYVIIQYHSNDYPENVSYLANGNHLPVRSEQSFDSLKRAIERRQGYYPLKHLLGLSKALGRMIFRPEKPDTLTAEHEARSFLKVLESGPPALQKSKIIVFKMDVFNKLNDDFADALDRLVQQGECDGMDIHAVRLGAILTKDDYFVLDDHINSQGHQKIAETIRQQFFSKQILTER
jgi:hypothetical protein